MKRNYYQEFLAMTKSIDKSNKPKLLLHVCCAPCSSHCISVLDPLFDITVFYYNPNISPFDEYERRYKEEVRFLKEAYPHIKVINAEYDNQSFEELANGLEDLPEGGERCKKCYRLRLSKTGEYAKQNGFDYFTTTLTVSPYKHSDTLNQIGEEVSKQCGVKYLFSDFKKQDGYKHSIELSKKYNLYRQDYCGCQFSKAFREKYLKLREYMAKSNEDYDG